MRARAYRAVVAGAALAAILGAAWIWVAAREVAYQPLSDTEVSEALVRPLPSPPLPPPPPPVQRP
jgi:hypothetical protein